MISNALKYNVLMSLSSSISFNFHMLTDLSLGPRISRLYFMSKDKNPKGCLVYTGNFIRW